MTYRQLCSIEKACVLSIRRVQALLDFVRELKHEAQLDLAEEVHDD